MSNKLLLVGRRLLRYLSSVGNFYGTVKRYNLSKDTSTLKFSDDSWEEITFDDVMKLNLIMVLSETKASYNKKIIIKNVFFVFDLKKSLKIFGLRFSFNTQLTPYSNV